MVIVAKENLLRGSISAKASHYFPFFFVFFDLSISIMAVIFNGGRRRGGILAFMVVLPKRIDNSNTVFVTETGVQEDFLCDLLLCGFLAG